MDTDAEIMLLYETKHIISEFSILKHTRNLYAKA